MRILALITLILYISCTEDITTPSGYTLTVAMTQSNSGIIDIDPQKDGYDIGESVTLTAIPNDNRAFYRWSGDYTSSDSSITLIMNSDKILQADMPYFVLDSGKVVIRDVPDTIQPIGTHARFSLDLDLIEDLNYQVDVTLPGSYNSLYFYNLKRDSKNIRVGSYPNADGVDSAIAGETDWWDVRIKDNDKDTLLYKIRFDYHVKWE